MALLPGGKFRVNSDHLNLKYLTTQRNLSRRQARWLETLQHFDLDIHYKAGSDNMADPEAPPGLGGVRIKGNPVCAASSEVHQGLKSFSAELSPTKFSINYECELWTVTKRHVTLLQTPSHAAQISMP